MSYIDPVRHRLGEWGARPPKTKGAIITFGDALEDATRCRRTPSDPVCKAFYAAPADPWAKQGEGTFTAPLPANYSKVPTKPRSSMLPLAMAGAALVGVMLFLKQRKA